jgi:hypothetical protein
MSQQFDTAYSVCTIGIKRDEDWNDQVHLKRLMADGSTSDFDFTGVAQLDLYIRPLFDHTTLIVQLSSTIPGGNALKFDPAVPALLQIVLLRTAVIATIPTGTWQQFLVATFVDGSTEEIWRGPLFVYPGKIA